MIPRMEYLKRANATQNIEDFASDVLGVEEKFGARSCWITMKDISGMDHAKHAMTTSLA